MSVPFLKRNRYGIQHVFSLKGIVCILSLFSCANLLAGQLTLESLSPNEADNSFGPSFFEESHDGAEVHSSSERDFWRNKVSFESSWKDKSFFKSEYTERSNSLQLGQTRTSTFDISMNFPVWGDSVRFKSNIKSGRFRSFASVINGAERYSINDYLAYPDQVRNSQFDIGEGLMNFGVQGKFDYFDYGIEYNRVGKRYKNTGNYKGFKRRDREGFNYWVRRKWNDLSLKVGYSDTWNNVNSNPAVMRYTEQVFKISSSYALSKWPYSSITFDYKTGKRFSSFTPNGKKPYTGSVSSFGTSLYFSYDNIDFSLGSFLEFRKNSLNPEDRAQTLAYYFNGSFSPVDSLYFYPSINYSVNKNEGAYSYRYNSLDTSLSVTYSPNDLPINLTYYVSRSQSKSNDGYTDSSAIYNNLSLEWVMTTHNKKKESALRFEVEQANYQDHVYDTNNYKDFYVGVRWIYSFN